MKSISILERQFALHKILCHFGAIGPLSLTGCLLNYFLITLYFYLLTFKVEMFKRLFTRTKLAFFIVTTWLLAIGSGVFISHAPIDKAASSITRCYVAPRPEGEGVLALLFLFIIMVILYANYRIRKSVHWLTNTGDGGEVSLHVRIAIDQISIHIRAMIWLGATIVCLFSGGLLYMIVSWASGEKFKNVIYLLILTNQPIYPVLLLINACHRSFRNRKSRQIDVGNVPLRYIPRHLAAWVVANP